MGQFHPARVQKEEAIKDPRWESSSIESALDLLAENLSFLLLAVDQSVCILHFWLFLADLDHIVKIGDLDWEGRLLLAVDKTFMATLVCFPGAFST